MFFQIVLKLILFSTFIISIESSGENVTSIPVKPRQMESDLQLKTMDKVEYQKFMNALYWMRQSRVENMIRIGHHFRTLWDKKNDEKSTFSDQSTWRLYNFTTGEQFEDEFDCDLNLLADCESSLLRKIEIIERRIEVFTTNRVEEDEVASQYDVLNICKSLDKEFTCLINFAHKCEAKMTWSSFKILRYVIFQNNETIISCKQKELDWLGPKHSDDSHDQWIDADGMTHDLNPSYGPCIPLANISYCSQKYLGIDFDLGRNEIETPEQCESAYHFEHCVKQYVLEINSDCSLDEKESTVTTIVGSIKWNLKKNHVHNHLCLQLRNRWLKKTQLIGVFENNYYDHWDRAQRLTFDLKLDFINILDPECYVIVNEHDKPCSERFEKRLRLLWFDEETDQKITDSQIETETVCCAMSEFKVCVSMFVLLRCGKDSFLFFKDKANLVKLDQCKGLDYGSDICTYRLNEI